MDGLDLSALVHKTPQFLGVVQKDRVVNGTVDLKRRHGPLTRKLGGPWLVYKLFRGIKLKVPEFWLPTPPKGCAYLYREVGRLNLVPTPHLIENSRDGRQQAFADVVTRKNLPLKDLYFEIWTILFEQ
jgi:hypothetical protein